MMLLTKNNAALSLLFDLKLLNHANTEVLFGSDFPGDRTDMQVCGEYVVCNFFRITQVVKEHAGDYNILVVCAGRYALLGNACTNKGITDYSLSNPWDPVLVATVPPFLARLRG